MIPKQKHKNSQINVPCLFATQFVKSNNTTSQDLSGKWRYNIISRAIFFEVIWEAVSVFTLNIENLKFSQKSYCACH